MRVGRTSLVAAALAALALAVAGVLLAADILRWRAHLDRGDARFAAATGNRSMWDADELLPFAPARRLLGVDDDLRFRRAIQSFRLARPTRAPRDQHDVAVRAEAAFALARLERSDPRSERRSIAALLGGVLAFEQARTEQTDAQVYLGRSLDEFRRAIRLDPANDDAKYDLELVLNLVREVQEQGRGSGRSQRRGRASGQGAGSGSRGSGF